VRAKGKGFNIRAFVFYMIALSGLGLPVTGIALHEYAFSPFTAARHAWMSAHNILGVLFAVFSIWHAALNRKAVLNYFRGLAGHVFTGREAALAASIIAMALLIFTGHAFHMGG
jgi:hypothetical protein